eukprot:CAMPEP_0194586316 /NCGR_PEP_ID=MMETSP0292-20121207/18355_1 /TAXON_ID=39354 /ORGANISM="Heterosigma akashiwo, Strain CCMP2393" /LENGTH=48 /DNA_ID= /DNA_START= /DNA_END= /DNA_ORIENTATION=
METEKSMPTPPTLVRVGDAQMPASKGGNHPPSPEGHLLRTLGNHSTDS